MNKLTEFLSNEIIRQKLRNNTDKKYIQTIQNFFDKGVMSKEDFINTGRIMPKEMYLYEFKANKVFVNEVKDIIRYAGGYCIQILPTAEWLFDSNDNKEGDEVSTIFKSDILSKVEDLMWKHYVKKNIK